MSARLASAVLVNALVRRVDQAGGFATVLAKGDATAGAILIVALDRGEHPRLFERGIGASRDSELIAVGPSEDAAAAGIFRSSSSVSISSTIGSTSSTTRTANSL